jgi:hypothetical protein
MRSPIGPVLILLGLATTVVLVLVLFQTIGLRSDLDTARSEVAELRAQVESQEAGLTDEDLVGRLDELEAGIRDWLIATGADGGFDGTPAGSGNGDSEVLDRLDEILARVNALDGRIDEICEGVPVC